MIAAASVISAMLIRRGIQINAARQQEAEERAEELRLKKEAEELAAAKKAEKERAEAEAASHVYSHRGTAGEYEHSFKAYDEAISAGSRNIEQDLVLSADGVLFISHDLNAYRMTGVDAAYSSMTAEEIDRLETGAGFKVLRLSEVFDRYGRDVSYIIELKTADAETIRAFKEIVEEYGYRDIITVQSVYTDVLKQLEEIFPDMPKLFVCKSQQGFYDSLDMPYVDIISVDIDRGLMTEGNCDAAHDHGKLFSAWTLSLESSIRAAIDMGVDTYFTNDTPLALSLEREYGAEKRAEKEEE